MIKKQIITCKTIAVICLLSIIMSSLCVTLSAEEYVYDKPINNSMWEEPKFDDPSTYAYSFAFIGDTQCLTIGDRLNGTDHVERLYKYVAGTAEERKLEHVFVLGDITEVGYWNDYNMVNAAKGWPTVTEEWQIVQKSIFQLNGKVKYSLCRGNHDDYMMDDYFNIPEYTDQFKENGGFFSDTGATYPGGGRNKELNPKGTVYWSAVTGDHEETIANSWRTMELFGTKYLFITVDYNPSAAVVKWINQTLEQFPDHKAIITTHSYMRSNGTLIPSETGEVAYPSAYGPAALWERVFAKHKNVFMIVCGHATGANVPIYTVAEGNKGNKVYQFLINPQTYDLKEARKESEKDQDSKTHQDQGLVMYMNFSEDGKTISLNYYSTLLNKFLKGANYTVNVDSEIDEKGSIDMAGLSQFGQETPLITDKKTPTLDGTINEGEYSVTKVTKREDIAKGSISSDLTEYYAYDDDYLYYAVSGKFTTATMNLHLGSSLYYKDELNSTAHARTIKLGFNGNSITVSESDGYSYFTPGKDAACANGSDAETKNRIYEIKISRKYLSANGSPDNLLSYTLNINNAVHQFNLNGDAVNFLKDQGVTKLYNWTYNYAYFGTRPEVSPETTAAPETTAPDVSTDTDSGNTGAKGCGASLAITPLLFVASLGTAVTLISKKKKEQ